MRARSSPYDRRPRRRGLVSTSTANFDSHLLEIVDSFLQTVVVVDDRAFRDPSAIAERADPDGPISGLGRAVHGELTRPSAPDEHDLDPKKVTDAFARAGLICALLAPGPGEEVDDEFLKTARRADLVILDWVFNRDEGRMALGLLKGVLRKDEAPERQRLRTIVVYTGQVDLHGIASKVREVIDEAYTDCDLALTDNGLSITKGPVRAAVFAKETAPDLPGALANRRVLFEDLPARARSEFAVLTNGLVTSVALAALAALRDDTHRILKVLSPGLDAAYLGHRSALPEPTDAEAQLVALVSSEMRSVIEDHDIGRYAQHGVLNRWLAQAMPGKSQFGQLIDATRRLSLAQVEEMLRTGLGKDQALDAIAETAQVSKSYLTKVKKAATRVFVESVGAADEADDQFGNRMALRTTYSRPLRSLHLGTIVLGPEGQYLVCVQPLCDSVRIFKVRAFPFLRLERASRSKTSFVVPGRKSGTWQHLLLTSNPRDLVIARFKPNSSKLVAPRPSGPPHIFKDTSHKRYSWVGELKQEFAQKVAVDLAQEFAQVAVDDAEMFRINRS